MYTLCQAEMTKNGQKYTFSGNCKVRDLLFDKYVHIKVGKPKKPQKVIIKYN